MLHALKEIKVTGSEEGEHCSGKTDQKFLRTEADDRLDLGDRSSWYCATPVSPQGYWRAAALTYGGYRPRTELLWYALGSAGMRLPLSSMVRSAQKFATDLPVLLMGRAFDDLASPEPLS